MREEKGGKEGAKMKKHKGYKWTLFAERVLLQGDVSRLCGRVESLMMCASMCSNSSPTETGISSPTASSVFT